ncbi:GNAT family N-acetyltransferase [Robiginitalea sp. SC105]|nr:GNAT family N-acetyltransferase [Robiginitalea sp. SC105]
MNHVSFRQFRGYLANLGAYASLDAYLKAQLSSKRRNNIRRYIRRLEGCFQVTYVTYRGQMDRELYDRLINRMKEFLYRRFRQRGDDNEMLRNWEFIERTSYDLIKRDQASLFVVYRDQEPIGISLNYLVGRIFLNAIGSFDIDFNIFRLGQVQIYKQIEWCFEEGMQMFDLGVGDLDYKLQWCDVTYPFEHRVHYRGNNFLQVLMARVLVGFLRFKEYLKRKNLHRLYHLLRKGRPGATPDAGSTAETLYETLALPKSGNVTGSPLKLGEETNRFLRKPVYDFLYLNQVPAGSVSVFRMHGPEEYLIRGKAKAQAIRITQKSNTSR